MDESVLMADMHVAEAGRALMAQQLTIMLTHMEGVLAEADVTAVHEMRKSIRRTFTCFKLFQSFFEPETLTQYKRGFRRLMQRLGYSRDLAVFRLKLANYNTTSQAALDDLSAYWENQQIEIDAINKHYLNKPKPLELLQEYQVFTETPGSGVLKKSPWAPVKLRHHLPILVYRRVAAVRAFDDKVKSASAKQLHRLRIQFKDLRYSLEFFSPLLGPEIQLVLSSLKQSQEILGDLNDTLVALDLLQGVVGLEASADHYRAFQSDEQERLIRLFLPVWQEFDQPPWRRDLAEAIAHL